ncbi:MAG: HD domain-containing protein [Thermoleophilaceae bacterium]|nr:HD domain-containing protein [Thermoleophilaceae bacterium]
MSSAIAELQAGQPVEGVFACTRKDLLTARTGTPYLALELRDRSGTIRARAFRDAQLLASGFDRGDLVWVAGRTGRFREELQLELSAVRRADTEAAAPEEFLPRAYRDVEELDGFLEHLAREVHDPALTQLLARFLDDDVFRAAFRRAPCTRDGHHAYLGGLLEHTVAVATLAQETCILHPRLDSDVLVSAAILHDAGKTREWDLGAEIGRSDEGRLLGHVALGDQLVAERARGLASERVLAVRHCVLTHHGDGRFCSAEALALHRLNALDAGVKGALEHGLR